MDIEIKEVIIRSDYAKRTNLLIPVRKVSSRMCEKFRKSAFYTGSLLSLALISYNLLN